MSCLGNRYYQTFRIYSALNLNIFRLKLDRFFKRTILCLRINIIRVALVGHLKIKVPNFAETAHIFILNAVTWECLGQMLIDKEHNTIVLLQWSRCCRFKSKCTGSEVSSSSLGATVITLNSPLRTMGCGFIDAHFWDCNGDDPF